MGRPIEQRSEHARRLGDVIGHERLAEKIAALTGKRRAVLYEWERNGWPVYALTIIALLEATPRENWPISIRNALDHENVIEKI